VKTSRTRRVSGEAGRAVALERWMQLRAGSGASGISTVLAPLAVSAATGRRLTPRKFVAMPAVMPVTNAATGEARS